MDPPLPLPLSPPLALTSTDYQPALGPLQHITPRLFGQPWGDLVVASLNVDGLTRPKLGELLVLLPLTQWDVLILLDTRHRHQDLPHIRDSCHAALGYHSRVDFSPVPAQGPSQPRNSSPLPPGGQIVLVNHLWGRRVTAVHHDPSGLGVISSLQLSSLSGSLLIIGTYWPAAPTSNAPPDSQGLSTRLSTFLAPRRPQLSPQAYIEEHIQSLTHRHQRKPGTTTVLLGDFNRRWANPAFRHWREAGHWDAPLQDCTEDPDIHTFWRRREGTPVSWIDHGFIHRSSFCYPSGGGTLEGGFWSTITDHTPIVLAFRDPSLRIAEAMVHGPAVIPSTPVRIDLDSHPRALSEYRDNIAASCPPPLPLDADPASKADRLLKLSELSVAAVPDPPTRRSRRHRYYNGWSPLLIAIKAHLLALSAIHRSLMSRKQPNRGRASRAKFDQLIGSITKEWERAVTTLTWPKNKIDPRVWQGGLSAAEWKTQPPAVTAQGLRTLCQHDFQAVSRVLHGRHRSEYRLGATYHMRRRELQRLAGRIGEAIRALTLDPHTTRPRRLEELDLRPVSAPIQDAPLSRHDVHSIVTAYFRSAYANPSLPPPSGVHEGTLRWQDLQSEEAFLSSSPALPTDIPRASLHALWRGITHSPQRAAVHKDLFDRLHQPPSLDRFRATIKRHTRKSAGGPSGLTYAMVRAWPESLTKEVHQLLSDVWTAGHVPDWWKWKWLVPLPKPVPSPGLTDLRPIMLLEVLRKIWSDLLLESIATSLQRHRSLSPNHHAFLPRKGTSTANLRVVNALECSVEHQRTLFGSSWDISKAFDSVSPPIIRLAWERLGVPAVAVDWLLQLDAASSTVVRSEWAWDTWTEHGHGGFPDTSQDSFQPARGTGQGDVSSPLTWTAVFDILLTALDLDRPESDPFPLHGPTGALDAPDIAYADDLLSFSGSLPGLQRKADLVSAFTVTFGLQLAIPKLRVFRTPVGAPTPAARLTVHTAPWTPHQVPLLSEGTIKCLGVLYSLDHSPAPQLLLAKSRLQGALRCISTRAASIRTAQLVLDTCVLARATYPAVLSHWSLDDCLGLDRLLAAEYRRRTKNLRTSQLENLFQPPERGGLGFRRLSTMIQNQKIRLAASMSRGDSVDRLTIAMLTDRATRLPAGQWWFSSVATFRLESGTFPLSPAPRPVPEQVVALDTPLLSLASTPLLPRHRSLLPLGLSDVSTATTMSSRGRVWNRALPLPAWLLTVASTIQPPSGPLTLQQGHAWLIHPPSQLADTSRLFMIDQIGPRSIHITQWRYVRGPCLSISRGALVRLGTRTSITTPDGLAALFPADSVYSRVLLGPCEHQRLSPLPGNFSRAPCRLVLAVIPECCPALPPLPHDPPTPSTAHRPPHTTQPLSRSQPAPTPHDIFIQVSSSAASPDPLTRYLGTSDTLYTGSALVTTDEDYEWEGFRITFPATVTAGPEDLSDATLLATLLAVLHQKPHLPPSTIHLPSSGILRRLRQHTRRPHSNPTVASLLDLTRPLLAPHRLATLPKTRAKKLNLTAPLPVQAAFVLPHIAEDSFLDSWRSPLRWRDIQTVPYATALLALHSHPVWALPSGLPDLRNPLATISEARRLDALSTRDQRSDHPRWLDSNIPHAAKVWGMASGETSSRAWKERLIHERHWLVRPRAALDRSPLPSPTPQPLCPLCGLPLSYRHVLQECQHPPVRLARDQLLADVDHFLETDDPRAELYGHVLHLTRQPGGHSILLGNWRTPQVDDLRRRLLTIDGLQDQDLPRLLDALHAIFRRLTTSTWTEWRAAISGRPSPPRFLHPDDRIYAVKRGRSPGLYYSAAEAQLQTHGFPGSITRTFRTMADATAFMAISIDPPLALDRSTCHETYTDGSSKGHKTSARAGWGFVALPPASDLPLVERSGPVVTSPDLPDFLGATKHSNNTAELTAIDRAITWALLPESPQPTTLLLYSDSELAIQKVLLPPSSATSGSHQVLAARVRQSYLAALARFPIYLIWTKGHDLTGSRAAHWNAVADRLADTGRLAAMPPLAPPSMICLPLPEPSPDICAAVSPRPSLATPLESCSPAAPPMLHIIVSPPAVFSAPRPSTPPPTPAGTPAPLPPTGATPAPPREGVG